MDTVKKYNRYSDARDILHSALRQLKALGNDTVMESVNGDVELAINYIEPIYNRYEELVMTGRYREEV